MNHSRQPDDQPSPESAAVSPTRPSGSRISEAQAEVAQAFFATAESTGFCLAGGAALIVAGAIDRTTKDIDAFTHDADVPRAADALEAACRQRGWGTERLRTAETFARVVVRLGDDEVLVELAQNMRPLRPPSASFLGPVLDVEDLAGQKVLALFTRAAPRDFADVYTLAARFGKPGLLALAAERDAGFDLDVFGQMMGFLDRIEDRQLPMPPEQVPMLRAFFSTWATELRSQ